MKKLKLALATLIIVMGGTTLANADPGHEKKSKLYVPDFPIVNQERVITPITPNDLVSNGYRGRYDEYGIPGFEVFTTQVRLGTITAEDLVIAGFMDYRYTAEEMMDDDLIKDIDHALYTFIKGRN